MAVNNPRADSIAVGSDGEASFGWLNAMGGIGAVHCRNFRVAQPPHMHTTFVMGVVESGSALVRRGDEEEVARAGDVLLLAPYDVHAEYPIEPSGWTFRCLYPTTQAVAALAPDLRGASGARAFRAPIVRDASAGSHIARMVDVATGACGDASVTERFAKDALRGILGTHLMEVAAPSPTMEQVRRFIHAAAGPFRVSELSSLTGLSPYHVMHKFRDVYGLSPYAYYAELRVARAKELLVAGANLASTGSAVGFADQSHFTRQFKRTTGLTPGRYARMLQLAAGGGVSATRESAARE
jgi:AraC-like DNA-binding protein